MTATFTRFFDRFTRRVEITGVLVARTALRIGVGKGQVDVGSADLLVLRSADGMPLIPGSSLKGVVRSAVESVLRGQTEDWKRYACDPFADRCVPDGGDDDEGADQPTTRARADRRREQLKGLCLTCATFGAPGLMSHVSFDDARPLDEVSVERRDGVAIDRDLRRMSGAKKYDFEVVAAGSRFKFGIAIDSEDLIADGLVTLGLDLLGEGFARIGGSTSRGLGWVAPESVEVTVVTAADLLAGSKPSALAFEELRGAGRWALAKALGREA